MWITPEKGQLIKTAPICWKQSNHTKLYPDSTKPSGFSSKSLCNPTITVNHMNSADSVILPGTDWVKSPGIWFLAPNGTHWICGANLWPQLSPGWTAKCTLGLLFAHGQILNELPHNPINFPIQQVRWTPSVFHWYDYLAAIFVPSLGTADIIFREEALTNLTRRASNDNMMETAAFNSRQALMC